MRRDLPGKSDKTCKSKLGLIRGFDEYKNRRNAGRDSFSSCNHASKYRTDNYKASTLVGIDSKNIAYSHIIASWICDRLYGSNHEGQKRRIG